ncbi:MAG: hypothetical protein GY940_01265, partial [bacterium]|nr:hypothetical protein [bacterium]
FVPIQAGLGILISGVVVFWVNKSFIEVRTNADKFPQVERVYNGFNMIIIGVIAIIGLTLTMMTLFESGFNKIILPLGLLLVYGSAWAYETKTFCEPLEIKYGEE